MPSSTLTWRCGANPAVSATTSGGGHWMQKLNDAVVANAGDSNFKWQVASLSTTNPFYCVLKRKDGSAGRLLFLSYSSAPANANPPILGSTSITANCPMVCWFPSGNVDTPSNLSAASGTVMGNDAGATGCVLFGPNIASGNTLTYWECEDAVVVSYQSTAASTHYAAVGGKCFVDSSDVEIDGVVPFSNNSNGVSGYWSGSSAPVWTNSVPPVAGAVTHAARITFSGGSQNVFYRVSNPPQSFLAQSGSPVNDPLLDTGTTTVWFLNSLWAPAYSQPCGKGVYVRLRQIGYGPESSSAFQVYNTTGPTVQARSMLPISGVTAGVPWMTNFKLNT